MPGKLILASLVSGVIKKTFDRKAIKDNIEQASTKVAVAAAAAAGAMEIPGLVTEAPKSEAELITQVILAMIALFLYYRDDKGSK